MTDDAWEWEQVHIGTVQNGYTISVDLVHVTENDAGHFVKRTYVWNCGDWSDVLRRITRIRDTWRVVFASEEIDNADSPA